MSARKRKLTDAPGRTLTAQESAERWDDYAVLPFATGHPLHYLTSAWQYRLPLYWEITKRVAPGGSILEVGVGAGPHLIWLGARGYRVTGVDYRARPIEVARDLASQMKVEATLTLGDAFDLAPFREFDLAFSIGMIEHWERARSIEALRQQALAARVVVAEIPSLHTHLTGEVTDERFYTLRELAGMLRAAGLTRVRTFAYGDVPTRSGRLARLAFPPGLLRLVQQRTGRLAMSLVAIGER